MPYDIRTPMNAIAGITNPLEHNVKENQKFQRQRYPGAGDTIASVFFHVCRFPFGISRVKINSVPTPPVLTTLMFWPWA